MTVLVLGAGGFLGLNTVDALLAAGVTPRCARRPRGNVLALRARRVPLVAVELDDLAGLTAAMADTEVVIHAAGHYPRLSLDPAGARATGARQMANVLDAAAGAGVRRLVYVSSTATVAPAPGGGPSDERHVFDAPPGLGAYHDLKWHMEALARAERRLEVVVACPGACIGPWDLRVGTTAFLLATARGLAPPHPDGVVNLVDARDVGAALVALARSPAPPARVLLSAGSRRLHALLVELAARYHAPAPAAPLSAAAAIELADAEEARVAASGGRAAIARELVDLIVHGVPVDAQLAEARLGLRWRTLSDTLDAWDAWARRMRLLPEAPPKEPEGEIRS